MEGSRVALALAAGMLSLIAYQHGLLRFPPRPARTAADAAGMQGASLKGYELSPGPGSGYIWMYGRGVHARPRGHDLHITVDEIRLVAADRLSVTKFRSLALSIHRRVEGSWKFVGSVTHDDVASALEAGTTYTFAKPQEFIVASAADICAREPCYFRLHVIGQVGSNRPGWDVTDLRPVTLQ